MADLTKTVEIIFGAVDNTGGTLSSIAGGVESTLNNVSTLTAPLAKVADAAVKAEAAILSMAAAYGSYAMVKAAEFEQAQIDLNKVLADGDPVIAAFTDTAMQLGEQYGISSAQVLQGVANFKQAGFTAEEAVNLQKNALDLMIAGDVDAAKASEILVSAIKGFGASAEDAGRYVEALNNVSNDYATDVAQLAEGMARVAPIANTMGFSFEETTGLLTPMIEVFRDGSLSAEALKTGLLKLLDDSKPVQEALKGLGVSQLDLNGQMRSGKDIFYDVATAFGNLEQNQKLVFAQQLFGIEQAPKLVTVFDNLAKVNQITASAMAQTGSVAKEVELRLDSATQQAKSFGVAFDNLAIGLGAGLNEQFKGVVSGGTSVLQTLEQIVKSGGLNPLFEAMRPYIEDFSATMQNIAKNLPAAFESVDFSGLLSALKDLGFEIGGIFANVDLNTPEGLARAIQFVVDSLESLTRVTSGIVEAWKPAIATFVAGVDEFNNLSDGAQKSTGNILGFAQVFENLKDKFISGSDALDTIGKALTAIAGINAATALSSFATVAANPVFAALAAAIGATGFAIYQNINAWDDYKARQDAVATSTANLTENQAKIKDRLAEISERTGITVSSMDELNKAVDEGRLVFNEATGAYERAGQGVIQYQEGAKNSAESANWFADAVNKVAESLGVSNDAAAKAKEGFNSLEEAERYLTATAREGHSQFIELKNGLWFVTDGAEKAGDAQQDLGNKTKDAALKASEGSAEWKRVQDVLLATQKQADDFKIKMGELANERYEIDVRAAVDLQTAQIEAETARISSAFQSTSDVIASLTQGVTDLWTAFADHAGFKSGDALAEAAMRMEDRLDRELALKEEMTRAVVEQATATSNYLNSGQPLISIDAKELAPELEMVFDKILKYTQIKATQQGLSLLVGL